jgi:hypothetical protein
MKIHASTLHDRADIAQAIRLRHTAYCLPVAGRPPLTLCPHVLSEGPGADGNLPHDSADVDPHTYHYGVWLDGEMVGSARRLIGAHSALKLCRDFSPEVRADPKVEEPSRLCLSTAVRGRDLRMRLLLTILGRMVIDAQIGWGCTTWIATLTAETFHLFNSFGFYLEPVGVVEFSGQARPGEPLSRKPLFAVEIPLLTLAPSLYRYRPNGEANHRVMFHTEQPPPNREVLARVAELHARVEENKSYVNRHMSAWTATA